SAFVADLPVGALPGVGKVTAGRLNRFGLYSCSDIQGWGLDKLVHHFGAFGEKLHRMAQGRDERPVVASRIRKSISVERTYDEDISVTEELNAAVGELLQDLSGRFDRIRGEYS